MRIFRNCRKEALMRGFLKVVKLSALIIVMLSLILSFASCKRKDRAQYDHELSILLHDKQRLKNEREKILLTIENELGKAACMSIVFVELDSALYTDAFPIMSARDEGDASVVGVMALSEDELPGLEGKITLSEYNELIDSGWGNALYWDGQGELSAFIDDMTDTLTPLGIDLPGSLIFADGAYSPDYDELLLDSGILNIVHSGENELSFVEKSKPSGVWHPGCIGWRCVKSSAALKSTKLKETIELEGGYALFKVGFDNSASADETSFFPIEGDATDEDRVDKFRSMIANFKASILGGKITVDSIEDSRAFVTAHFESRERAEAENELRLQQIEAELDEITRQINQLYKRYY